MRGGGHRPDRLAVASRWGLGPDPNKDWAQLGATCVVFLAAYVPVVVGGSYVFVALVSGLRALVSGRLTDAIEPSVFLLLSVPVVLIASPIVFALAILWCGLTAFAVVLIAAASCHLAGLRSTDAPAATATGAAVALAAGSLIWLQLFRAPWGAWPVYAALTGGLLVGQVAGGLHAIRDLRRRRRRPAKRVRFGVGAILGLMVAASVVLSVLRIANLTRPDPVLALLCATAVAALGYAPTQWLVNRWADRRLRRRQLARREEGGNRTSNSDAVKP